MKPAPFQYVAAASLPEALALLKEHGDNAKILAGGQSLIPTMNMRLAKPEVLVDIKRIPGLAYIREEDGWLAIGGLTTHAELELSELVRSRCPLLHTAASHIGYPAIRNRGTIGGSLAHNDPAATLPAVVTCLGGIVVVTGMGGPREIPAAEFFLDLYTTAMEHEELVTEVRVPVTGLPNHGSSWVELNRRTGDFALVAAGAQVVVADGVVQKVSLTLTGVDTRPVVVDASALMGQTPSAEALERVGALAQQQVDPGSDVHATAEYRKAMVKVMVGRALAQACDRAQGR
ncbi:MAG TPA: xanthine dehydrogenase family protein subunit M [Symbiobacteriaceae bacterium]|nr:xanthine dehydrogenase family protein subunit M [Symbiobacteriaceae bacterium]